MAEAFVTPLVNVEVLLANGSGQQQLVGQVSVAQSNVWTQFNMCVQASNTFDRILIRGFDHPASAYPRGYLYVDNVNVCCCAWPALAITPSVGFGTNSSVSITWRGPGQLQTTDRLYAPGEGFWQDVTLQSTHHIDERTVIYDFNPQPDPPALPYRFFRVVVGPP
jgi:hypothetical protein